MCVNNICFILWIANRFTASASPALVFVNQVPSSPHHNRLTLSVSQNWEFYFINTMHAGPGQGSVGCTPRSHGNFSSRNTGPVAIFIYLDATDCSPVN